MAYKHSAYWYSINYGWTYSEAKTYAGKYWDEHTFRLRDQSRLAKLLDPADGLMVDSEFNPLMLAACAMIDIGVAVATAAKELSPRALKARRERFQAQLAILRRPFYYARETERRRRLAADRRKLHRRRTAAPMPTPEALLAAWRKRKESKAAAIVLGGLLHDLECYVDNCLRIDRRGRIVGRNRGIRGWIRECLPELTPKYKTLMRYKAMAIRLRQATRTQDPIPTSELLSESPRHEVVKAILENPRQTFAAIEEELRGRLDPDRVFPGAKTRNENCMRKSSRREKTARENENSVRKKHKTRGKSHARRKCKAREKPQADKRGKLAGKESEATC